MRRIVLALALIAAAAADACQTFPQTGKTVCGLFLTYWRTHGGLAQQGYPISDVFKEQSSNGQVYDTQYFERAVFERHPENAGTPYEVLLSLLGREKFDAKYGGGGPKGSGKVGERLVRGTVALTVLSANKSASPLDKNGKTYQPKPGYVVLTLDVLLEHVGAANIDYNRFNFRGEG